nr:hypothetical protein [Nostoc sp. ChiSLP03a]
MPNAQCPMPNAQCPMPNAQCPMPNAHYNHHKLQLDGYGKDFMNRYDVSVYIVPFDSLILTLRFLF